MSVLKSQLVVRSEKDFSRNKDLQKLTSELGKISRVDRFWPCLFLNDGLIEMMHLEKNTATVESCAAILCVRVCSTVTPHLWISTITQATCKKMKFRSNREEMFSFY